MPRHGMAGHKPTTPTGDSHPKPQAPHCDTESICVELTRAKCSRMCDVGGKGRGGSDKLVICGGELKTCSSVGHGTGKPCASECGRVHAFIAESSASKNLAVELAADSVKISKKDADNKASSISAFCKRHAKDGFATIDTLVSGHEAVKAKGKGGWVKKDATCDGHELVTIF